MTDVAIPEPHHSATPAPTDLQQWVQDASAAHKLASSLCKTSFVPAQYKGKPEEGAVAILAGRRWGLDPLASMQAFDLIGGTAAPRAITLRAIVQAIGHEIWIHEESPDRVVVRGRRCDTGREYESTWTTERARGMGLLDKDNWKKQRQAMLVARATGECARRMAADQILGIAYTAEELADTEVSIVPERRTVAQVLAAAPVPAHDPATGEVPDHVWADGAQIADEVAADETAERG